MSIKIERALRATRHLPMAQGKMLGSIPAELIERITSAELAMVLDSLNRHWHKARAFEANEIRSDGRVYTDIGYHELGPMVPYPPQPALEPMEVIIERVSGRSV